MSKFALCPRGYGKTSFRIQEALQYGAIPVYISDEYLCRRSCILLGENEFDLIDGLGGELNKFPFLAKQAFNDYYTYSAVANMIYENLSAV